MLRMTTFRGPNMMMRQDFNRRHSPNRRKTRVPGFVSIDGRLLPVTIRDVSFDGMKLAVPEHIAPGTPITIAFMETTVPAIVHWSDGTRAGVRLLDRLERHVLVALEAAEDELADYR